MSELSSASWAVVGRANVGKSTLANALAGRKFSIVSPKPNTTQKHALGCIHQFPRELVLVDLPGWVSSQSRNLLGRMLQMELQKQLEDCDGVLWLVTYGQWQKEEEILSERLQQIALPIWLVVTQIDRRIAADRIQSWQQSINQQTNFCQKQFLTSALKQRGLSTLTEQLFATCHPVESWRVAEDALGWDKFWFAELIREQVFLQLHQELPYQVAVTIDEIQHTEKRRAIWATIWTANDNHRGMIIGKQGQRLKNIGMVARQSIQAATDKSWHVQLSVLVKKDWYNKSNFLHQLGW